MGIRVEWQIPSRVAIVTAASAGEALGAVPALGTLHPFQADAVVCEKSVETAEWRSGHKGRLRLVPLPKGRFRVEVRYCTIETYNAAVQRIQGE